MVIALMGVTGSGKSSFISLLADQDVEVSHSLHSDTASIKIYSFNDQRGRTVYLLDTPGFDDTTRSDAEVLKDISYLLAAMFAAHIRLAGLIYLHRISDARMPGSAVKNLRMFQAVCGESNYRHVVLATTMWAETGSSDARNVQNQRLRELQDTYWDDMIRSGSKVMKHDGHKSSALEIVRTLTARAESPVTLAIQRQLVNEGQTLDETDAGKIVFEEVIAAKRKFKLELDELQESLEEAEQDDDQEGIESLRTERAAIESKARRRARDGDSLGVDIRQLAREQHPLYHNLISALQQEDHDSVQTAGFTYDPDPRVRNLELRLEEEQKLRKEKEKENTVLKEQLEQRHREPAAETSQKGPSKALRFGVERKTKTEEKSGLMTTIMQFLKVAGSYLPSEDERFYVAQNSRSSSSKSWSKLSMGAQPRDPVHYQRQHDRPTLNERTTGGARPQGNP
ncbi:hypothetical protein Z517_07798 [Fonsecaea pedrosoi CBS 271.37]|uniref:Unplaced genomic scaffold supercont1.5, whole genome shotgun sequence n=1 Tax=Fonsecaea pedrosoi CBS 271.37 TaxID=1442368 RepID=A0A0D2GHD5_9EURO|nr:uncharacterized protein Z517_07798 [Fonsecaea pedrosoi CBS 271.37]KIW77965.1 hypothetical protein Z517_07798 [Fonsecaea pedrosoi CBS 271.37]